MAASLGHADDNGPGGCGSFHGAISGMAFTEYASRIFLNQSAGGDNVSATEVHPSNLGRVATMKAIPGRFCAFR
jgi:hypothetical protein